MKNTFKRLFSLMLVAVLLVSIVPFQAMAASGAKIKLVDDQNNKIDEFDWTGEGEPQWIDAYEGTSKNIKEDVGYFIEKTEYKGTTYYKFYAELEEEDPVVYVDVNVIVKIGDERIELAKKVPAGTAPSDSWIKDAYPAFNRNDYEVSDWYVGGNDYSVRLTKIEKEPVVEEIKIFVKHNNSDNEIWSGSKAPANGEYSKVEDLLSYVWNSKWDDNYKFDHAWSHEQQKNVAKSGKIYAGDTVYIMLTDKDSTNNGGSNNGSNNGDGNYKDLHDAYLYIFLQDTFKNPVKVHISDKGEIGYDGKVYMGNDGDIQPLVRKYFSAKDADGIEYDGLYIMEGSKIENWLKNNKVKSVENLNELRKHSEVHLAVWVGNATKKSSSSSNADSSNPKTGDNIFMAVTFMAVSATALTGLYFYNKKRMVK